MQTLMPYRKPNHVRSTVEIVITFVPLATLWALAWAALHFGYWWLSLLLAVPAAGFLVRLFMISARLRPWLLFPPAPGERLGGPRDRRADPDAL